MGKKLERILDIYLNGSKEEPLLNSEEELELAKKIREGDTKARERFIKANFRLVVSIAKKYVKKSQNLTLIWLIHEGIFGLIHAADNFDIMLGNRFSTYATYCIEGAIKRALSFDRGKNKTISLDFSKYQDEAEGIYEIIEDEDSVSPERSLCIDFLGEIIEEAMLGLKNKEREIIILSFGLEDGIPRSIKDIAKELGWTSEKVRRTKKKALRRLKKHKKLISLQ